LISILFAEHGNAQDKSIASCPTSLHSLPYNIY